MMTREGALRWLQDVGVDDLDLTPGHIDEFVIEAARSAYGRELLIWASQRHPRGTLKMVSYKKRKV
jgi:hypothetical protein